jgi:hypothetical protein
MRFWLTIGFVFITIIVVVLIYHDEYSTTIDYMSGVGSVASIYAILLAFIEFRSAKKSAQETKNAIESKIGEINHLLSYADLEKHIEYCSSISLYLKSGQYVAVAIRLEELKKVLLEVKNNQSIKDKNEFKIQQMVMRLGSDITAVGNKWKNVTELDSSRVLEHVNEVSTFLQDISTKLKYQTI